MNVLFRCEGSHDLGMGHVVRCLALADELSEKHGCQVSFAMKITGSGAEKVKSFYRVITPEKPQADCDEELWLGSSIAETSSSVLILDVRNAVSRKALARIRRKLGVKIVTIDDPEDKRLEADLAFYPPVPQVERMDWSGFKGTMYSGLEWVVLRKGFPWGTIRENKPEPSSLNILVSMGGSDPQGMTLKAVEALNRVEESLNVTIVAGPLFREHGQLRELLSGFRHPFDILTDVTEMAELMSGSDLALVSFGVTAYELACMGVPAVILSLTEDHEESASLFDRLEIGVSLGVAGNLDIRDLEYSVSSLAREPRKLEMMRKKALRLMDGKGRCRIAQCIMENAIKAGI